MIAKVNRGAPRRGMTLVLVMLIVSVTLAAGYAVLWSQGNALQIQQNSTSRVQARQAALAGMSIGLQRMHDTDRWVGADEDFDGRLSASERYEVSYQTGDASLAEGDDDYHLWPYRVMVRSTGYSEAGDNGNEASYQVQAVVQLVPRALSEPPAAWDELMPAEGDPPTLTQYAAGEAEFYLPLRIEGPVRLRSELKLANYNWSNAARLEYLADLGSMRQNGYPDYRPFTGPIRLPFSEQDSKATDALTALGVAFNDGSSGTMDGVDEVDAIDTYLLYPGGKLYSASNAPGSLSNTALEADPQHNPAGLFSANGNLELRDGAVIRGTLIGRRDIKIEGENVEIESAPLLPLYGTTEPVELPAVIATQNLEIEAESETQITGLVAVMEKLEFEAGVSSFELNGQVVLKDFVTVPLPNWDKSSDWWSDRYEEFKDLGDFLGDDHPVCRYYPVYLSLPKNYRVVEIQILFIGLQLFLVEGNESMGLNPAPRVTLRARDGDEAVRCHWPTDGGAIYAPREGDDGLQWDLLSWQEGE